MFQDSLWEPEQTARADALAARPATVAAAGTSLPELATSAVAAFKKRCDLAVGNVVGSNIFNIFLSWASVRSLNRCLSI